MDTEDRVGVDVESPVLTSCTSDARDVDVDACELDACCAWDVPDVTEVSASLDDGHVLLSSDRVLGGSGSAGPFMTAAETRVWKMGEGDCRLGTTVGLVGCDE